MTSHRLGWQQDSGHGNRPSRRVPEPAGTPQGKAATCRLVGASSYESDVCLPKRGHVS